MAELDRRTRTINLLIRFAAFVIYLVLGLLVFKAIENSGRHDEPGSTGKIWQGNHTRKGPTMEELKLNITRRFNISGIEASLINLLKQSLRPKNKSMERKGIVKIG